MFNLLLLLIALVTSSVAAWFFVKNKELSTEIESFSHLTPFIEANEDIRTWENKIRELKESYLNKKGYYDHLVESTFLYEEKLDLYEFGVYQPHFDFRDSEKYKAKILEIREIQKQMVKDKAAVTCHTKWTVNGSSVEGRKATDRLIKLAARAFNNECESAIANTTWRNVNQMKKRIDKAFLDINKLVSSYNISISPAYLGLKLTEFHLVHEYREQQKKEKEEQAELRQQAREEAKLEREIQEAQREAEKYQYLLDKAKAEAEQATGSKLDMLHEKIAQLSIELEEAKNKNERALSLAQQTRAGYVYVISNIGSFGKDVYKIGMTRRLDPMDRVRELGDASVPFSFDVHAIIYCDDAPTLENQLHKAFYDKRLNLKNFRREFFAVTLDEIENEVLKRFPSAEFIKEAEAQDYYESLSLRHQPSNDESPVKDEILKFPASL